MNTQKEKSKIDFKDLESEISKVFKEDSSTNEQKIELIMEVIKNKLSETKAKEYKLYPTYSETNHINYETEDQEYSLIVAYDSFHTNMWYFYVGNNPNIKTSYNSIWEKKMYRTEEECVKNAERWLSKIIE